MFRCGFNAHSVPDPGNSEVVVGAIAFRVDLIIIASTGSVFELYVLLVRLRLLIELQISLKKFSLLLLALGSLDEMGGSGPPRLKPISIMSAPEPGAKNRRLPPYRASDLKSGPFECAQRMVSTSVKSAPQPENRTT